MEYWVFLFISTLMFSPYGDTACTFPSDLMNSDWESTNFGTMTFTTNGLTLASTTYTGVRASWSCEVSSGTRYVIKTTTTASPFSITGYYYICLDLTKQNTYSYSYYLPSILTSGSREVFRQVTNPISSVSDICTETLDAGEFNVMVKVGNEANAKQSCAVPLQANFFYTYNDGSDRCGSTSPGTGRLDVCTSNILTPTFDYTSGCSQQVTYSANGIVNCVADLTSGSNFYQVVYNTDTTLGSGNYRFTCLMMTYTTGSDANITVSISQKPTNCESGQTSTVMPTGGALLTMTSFSTCIVSTTTATVVEATDNTTAPSSTTNIGLIVGLVVAAVVVIAIIVTILVCCFVVCKEPDNIIHVEENKKPKFDEERAVTPLTRDDVGFNLESPETITSADLMNGNLIGAIPTGSPGYGSGRTSVMSGRNSATMNGHATGFPNGSVPTEMNVREKPGDRPRPGVPSIIPGSGRMVIFNGDEKVLSGNDSRVITNDGFQGNLARSGRSDNGNFVRMSSIDENIPSTGYMGDMSPANRESQSHISLPKEKSNLMPPIETADPENGVSPRPDASNK